MLGETDAVIMLPVTCTIALTMYTTRLVFGDKMAYAAYFQPVSFKIQGTAAYTVARMPSNSGRDCSGDYIQPSPPRPQSIIITIGHAGAYAMAFPLLWCRHCRHRRSRRSRCRHCRRQCYCHQRGWCGRAAEDWVLLLFVPGNSSKIYLLRISAARRVKSTKSPNNGRKRRPSSRYVARFRLS